MSRTLAIGDIHGCFNALKTLLDEVDLQDNDTIITLGDYIDRGPDSRAVLDLVIELEQSHHLVPLRGNHEIMMLDAREKASWLKPWLSYGGDETLRSYAKAEGEAGSFEDIPQAHYDFLENRLLPYYENDTHFFVHAGADANTALEEQSDPSLYWRKYQNIEAHCSGKIMVCGHSPQQNGIPLGNEHSICIDTFAYGDGWLTCLDVESGTIWQANEARDTRYF
jgi:serine/threonine protein phosphatase 1